RQPEVPVIVTCGRLVQCKNFELLIRAVGEVIKQMPVRLALIGDGVERSNLEYLVRKLGLEKSVVFLGFQVNPYKYLKRSTVFALSSDIESFGLVLVEAMICGIPVVSTDCPSGPREIVTHEKNGLLSPVRDINKLADNILCVLKNKALSQEFVNANKVVVTMFDPNKITDEYQRMINEVCEKDKHLVLAGLNFDFELQQGDKNFWIELINEISGKFNRITIITIKQADMEMSEFMLGQCKVVIKYKSPFILATPGKLRRGLFQVNWQGRAFPSELAVVEKFFVGYGILRLLNQIFKHIQYGNVHLMDNMGFTNRSIAQFASSHGAGTTVSAISYQGHNVNIYHMYLKMSYQNKNLKVVPYSECFAAKLEQIGIPRKSLVQIHWGIKNDEVTFNTEQEIIAMRTELGLSKDKVVILWSGFIQQIRERSFMLAYHAAVEAVKLGLNAEFYFAFKPESFNEKYFGMAAKGVKISVTGIKQFVKLKSCCDIFYSPIINPQYIIAPPLTWIEVMNLGKPIVTTVAGGVDEIVEDGVTGFIANNEEELIKKLFVAVESYKQMKNMCISKVKEKYSIKRIGEQYVKMFNNGQ
ncbi:MAG: glycosyltransferase, partial [Elusimicrobiota bacterium]